MSDQNIETSAPVERSSVWKPIGVAAFAIALLGGNAYQLQKVNNLDESIAEWRTSVETRMAELRTTQTADAATQTKNFELLAEQTKSAHQQTAVISSRSRNESRKTAEQLARLAAEQEKQQQQMAKDASELTQVKEVATSATSKIADVSSEVTLVKTDVAGTKSDLEKTIADLRRATGDMGVMSGLIATNGKELAALRELGEKNYYEFDLTKAKTPHKVGNLNLLIKKTDAKRGKYTVELIADDKRVEKKDKTINEPVQFYASQSRQPYEIVVNEVQRDRLVGYLATPKVQMARK